MVTGFGNWRSMLGEQAYHVLFLDAPVHIFITALIAIWVMEGCTCYNVRARLPK